MSAPGSFLTLFQGAATSRPPVWMMRQAGRHLPEYLELRARARDFMDFCYSPSLACEATLQPIRRYDMDAAILFADILLVLDGLGYSVHFEKGVGPIVAGYEAGQPMPSVPLERALQKVSPVFETVERVRQQLDPSKALIGFCGAPWTVALYAIEGRGGTDKSALRKLAYTDPESVKALMDQIIEISAHYLAGQVKAGADALMLFESWAEGLPPFLFDQFIIAPNIRLIERVRSLGVKVPILAFPRGAGSNLAEFVRHVNADGVGIDTAQRPDYVRAVVPESMVIQGQLDPLLLCAGGKQLEQAVHALIEVYEDRKHIFNLGHGVRPETPISHVEKVVQIIRSYKRS